MSRPRIVDIAALAQACDLIREARHRQFGGMPMAIVCDLLDDMARLHADQPWRTRRCAWCNTVFIADHHRSRFCQINCARALGGSRSSRAPKEAA